MRGACRSGPGQSAAAPPCSARRLTTIQSDNGVALARINDDGTLRKYQLQNSQYGPFVVGADKNFWMIGSTSAALPTGERITPAGAITNIPIGGNQSSLSDLVSGGDGNLWFTGRAVRYRDRPKATSSRCRRREAITSTRFREARSPVALQRHRIPFGARTASCMRPSAMRF
jgi:hypothetical protein